MTKKEFLIRWAKSAAAGGAVEAFETDVERLARTLVRLSTSAVVNGLLVGCEKLPKKEREIFRRMIATVSPSVEQALAKLYE
jgi:uncharacterized membrane protein